MASNIEWTDIVGEKTITEGGFVGDLLKIARAHVAEAVDNNELTQAEAGAVYTAMIPAAFQSALKFAMEEELMEARADVEADKLETAIAQRALITRQKEGFDDDAKNKLIKQQLDSWSVAYSVAKDENSIPDSIKVDTIDSTMKSAMDALSVTVTTNPIGI